MDRSERILEKLGQLNIAHVLHRHQPMLTMEDCLAMPGVDWQQATMPKNVFLCNRQQTDFYLVLLRPDRVFRTRVVSKLLGVSRLSFASPEHLEEMLQLSPGAVNPFSLMFDQEGRVTLAVDEALLAYPSLLFHPGVNWLSVQLAASDFFQGFLPALGRRPRIITIPEE